VIEKIFIPTVNRPNDQITYNSFPDELKKRVTLVVQEWEYDQYSYDCDYLVLPKEFNISEHLTLAKTRDIIHKAGTTMKYCMADDDLILYRRNQKYFRKESNMKNSKRIANDDDILEMFELFDKWLDEPTVSFCCPSHIEFAPDPVPYNTNYSMTSFVCYNGPNFSKDLDDLPTTVVRYGEDTLFILGMLSRGYGNRISNEYTVDNISLRGKLYDTVWAKGTFNDVWADHKKIEELFPNYYKILLDDNGDRIKGGFRDYGKVKVNYKSCLNSYHRNEQVKKFFDIPV
jgi:hypothetical protein